jgi:DNA invertase Pin-like site-specific DNA recombinase
MPAQSKIVALYLRVSTHDQTVENQRIERVAAAARAGWVITGEYADEALVGPRAVAGARPLTLYARMPSAASLL